MEIRAAFHDTGEAPILSFPCSEPSCKAKNPFIVPEPSLIRLYGTCGFWHVGFPERGACLESLMGAGIAGRVGIGMKGFPPWLALPLISPYPTSITLPRAGSGPDRGEGSSCWGFPELPGGGGSHSCPTSSPPLLFLSFLPPCPPSLLLILFSLHPFRGAK